MSIRRRLEDAHFLLANGRPDGALLSACTAISATSRKRYPDRKAMNDREAFTKFLGEEMRVVTAGGVVNFNVRCPGADTKKYPDEMMPLQDVLYEFVRCTLAHEGRIGANVEFAQTDHISVEIKDDRIILGGQMLGRLLIVPEYAPENSSEFPQVAEMPAEVVGWLLFGKRRQAHAEYLSERQKRVEAIQPAGQS
jgi:hypothetical protein